MPLTDVLYSHVMVDDSGDVVHDVSTVDFDADVTHPVSLYGTYVYRARWVSCVGKVASREKLVAPSEEEVSLTILILCERGASPTEVTKNWPRLTCVCAKGSSVLGESGCTALTESA